MISLNDIKKHELFYQGYLYFILNKRVLHESLVNDEPILCLVSSCHAHRGLGQLATPSVPQLHAHQVLKPGTNTKNFRYSV
jgi:hypothetical protein